MNVQVSPDGKWWWNGQAWTPVGTVAAPAPTRPPGVLIAAVIVNVVGAAVVLLLGVLILVFSRTPELTQALSADTSADVDPTTLAVVVAIVVIVYGVGLAAINSLLGWLMIKRHAWAWITTIVLIGLGMLVELVQAIGSPQGLIWLVIFQVPPLVLLLLGPSRRWCHISGGQSQQPNPYPSYNDYPQAYTGSPPVQQAYPPRPAGPPPH